LVLFHIEWQNNPSKEKNMIRNVESIFFSLFRKTKYFYHGRLDWDERSSAGRYVRDNCKPLRVGLIVFFVIAFIEINFLFISSVI